MIVFSFFLAITTPQFINKSLIMQFSTDLWGQFMIILLISFYRSLFVSYQFMTQAYLSEISVKYLIITMSLFFIWLCLILINMPILGFKELIAGFFLLMVTSVTICIFDLKK